MTSKGAPRRAGHTAIAEACERQIYDGHLFIGTIAGDGHGNWRAFDLDGEQLGEVCLSFRAASDAVLAKHTEDRDAKGGGAQ